MTTMYADCARIPESSTERSVRVPGLHPASLGIASILTILVITIVATAGCLKSVEPPAPQPTIIDVVEAGTPFQDPYLEPTPPLCMRHDKIVLRFDSGTVEFDTPRPCVPLWRYRELGDPPDVYSQ